jgi:glucose/arabinose dehydrogenase
MRARTLAWTAAGAALAGLAISACSQAQPQPPAAKAGDVVVFGDYTRDAPGVRHHITVADLPKPFAHVSVGFSKVVPPPQGALPKIAAGFNVALYTSGLKTPRAMRTAPNGDVFVAEMDAGQIHILRAPDGAAQPSQSEVFATGLDKPFGMAFYPVGPNPQWLYVAELNRVVRFAYHNGDLKAAGPPEVVVAKLAASTGGHNTRDLNFSLDGKQMFISVGSAGNLAENLGKKTPAEAAAWDGAHGLGATWGDDENRADVLVADPDGKNLKVYAAGIRNCTGETIQPGTGKVWCSTNERDNIGDDLVPDYATSVKPGAFYGWPWYYMGSNEDPRKAGERPDLKGKVTVPDILIQAHSAAVQIRFYDGAGPNAFPAQYQGGAFIALHGSWNRSPRTGYKLVFAPMKDGAATGEYVDFMTGLVLNENDIWARPYGIAVMHDGSLLVGDDANGQVFRITPAK